VALATEIPPQSVATAATAANFEYLNMSLPLSGESLLGDVAWHQ
jgi:hypothetical protein